MFVFVPIDARPDVRPGLQLARARDVEFHALCLGQLRIHLVLVRGWILQVLPVQPCAHAHEILCRAKAEKRTIRSVTLHGLSPEQPPLTVHATHVRALAVRACNRHAAARAFAFLPLITAAEEQHVNQLPWQPVQHVLGAILRHVRDRKSSGADLLRPCGESR